ESWGQELFFKLIWESGRKFGLRCSSLRQRCLRIAEGVGVRGAHDAPHPYRAAEEVDLALADTLDAVDPAQDAAGFERLDGLVHRRAGAGGLVGDRLVARVTLPAAAIVAQPEHGAQHPHKFPG